MKIRFHKKHPCNPLFGKKETLAIGSVQYTRAVWFFCGLFDCVMWL